MKKLEQAGNNWVVGDKFWNRETDLARFIKEIDGGAHLLLVAQRRMGKTSLLREAARRLDDRYIALYIDLEKACSAADAVVELSLATHAHKPLWNKTKEVFGNILDGIMQVIDKIQLAEVGVTLRAGLTAGNWEQKAGQLLDVLANSDKPVLLLLDEVSILVNRMLKGPDFTMTPERRADTEQFLSWLRHESIKHKGKVRIVLSGSIGLEPILRQARMSATVNTFQPFELKPWDEATAVGCLEALANQYGVTFEEGAPAQMAERLGCLIPHHIQMFFAHVYDRCKRRGNMTFAADEIDAVYEQEMLAVRGHVELTHYEERLRLVLGDELLPLALDMLSQAAVTGALTRDALTALRREYSFEGRDVADAEQEIMWVLEHDGYLESGPNGYVFVSKLVRDWWKSRHKQFFTPVLEREG